MSKNDLSRKVRRNTKTIKIGNLSVGGNNPVRIQGMLKNRLETEDLLIREAAKLERAGAEMIRVAVKTKKDASIYALLRKKVSVPLAADIHFDYRLALQALSQGFEVIRLNPMNIRKKSYIKAVVKEAKRLSRAIRIGVNSGGFKGQRLSQNTLAKRMVMEVEHYLKIFEKEGFFDTIISFKASDVRTTLSANRLFSQKYEYPLHLGVTAAGPFSQGVIKSTLGIGILLEEGLGDIIRVSLTGPSYKEIRVAQEIVQALDLRLFRSEIVSCPTCSRCEVDLASIVKRIKVFLEKQKIQPLKCAVMGCVVNGPGEASQADIGVAFGKEQGVIFKGDKIIAKTNQQNAAKDLIRFMKEGYNAQ